MQPKASLSTATGGGKSPAAASSERSRTSTGHRNYHLMSTISGTVVVLLFGIATSFYIYQQQDAAPLAITSIITNASNLFTFLSFQSTETPNIEQDVDKSTTPTVAETGKEKLTFASPASVGFSKRVSWADLMASKPLEDGPHLKYHPSATDPCSPPQYGEDATFVTSSSLGVGDGVGGWVGKPGADPAYVSRTLMRLTCLELFVNQSSVLSLARAYHKVQADMERSGVLGSTTATVGRIVEGRELEIAHVGDSALFVVRPDGTEGTVVYKTTEQTFMFNGPLQLGTNSSVNVASDAESRNVPILAGDIVIAASDGVVDNLFPDDIAAISIAHSNEIEIARAIALRARQVSEDKGKFTPFEKGAREAGYNYKGGKVDDISVVVGRVVGA